MLTSPNIIVHVVDDDESLRTALTRLLTAMGFVVKAYTSAAEFLAREAGNPGGCLILDLSMPEMNGLELQEALAGDSDPLPIIFLTGRGDVRSCAGAMKAGAADFLTKPVNREELLAAVKNALAQDAIRRRMRAEESTLRAQVKQLTPREMEAFRLIVQGKLNKQIAVEMGTTLRTVKAHRAKVMQKLGAVSVAGLVKIAEQLRLTTEGPDDNP